MDQWKKEVLVRIRQVRGLRLPFASSGLDHELNLDIQDSNYWLADDGGRLQVALRLAPPEIYFESGNPFEIEQNQNSLAQLRRMRFAFTFAEASELEAQIARMKEFVERQISAVEKAPGARTLPDRNLKLFRGALVWSLKARIGFFRRQLAARLDPFRLTPGGFSGACRGVLTWAKARLAGPLNRAEIRDFLIKETNRFHDFNDLEACHAAACSMARLALWLDSSAERKAVFSEELQALFVTRRDLGGSMAKLIQMLHYLGAPNWSILCFPSLFLELGNRQGKSRMLLVWSPVCDYLESRGG